MFIFFLKQKTAYELRISDWSLDVCSSDLRLEGEVCDAAGSICDLADVTPGLLVVGQDQPVGPGVHHGALNSRRTGHRGHGVLDRVRAFLVNRSEEHTSELQSLMRISYAVFCLKKKITNNIYKKLSF